MLGTLIPCRRRNSARDSGTGTKTIQRSMWHISIEYLENVTYVKVSEYQSINGSIYYGASNDN